jgi:CheY-like chemotaxis protein
MSEIRNTSDNPMQDKLIHANKEYTGLYKLSKLIKEDNTKKQTLEQACAVLTEYFLPEKDVNIRIKYNGEKYCLDCSSFQKSKFKIERSFQTIYRNKAIIEVFYTGEKKSIAFSKEEANFIKKSSVIIASYLNEIEIALTAQIHQKQQYKILSQQKEKFKLLSCLSNMQEIIKSQKPLSNTLQQIAFELQKSMEYPEYYIVRILYNDKVYSSPKDFPKTKLLNTKWTIKEPFETIHGTGIIAVNLLKELPDKNISIFNFDEKYLVKKAADMITKYINDYQKEENIEKKETHLDQVTKKRFVRNFLYKNNFARDIFHDLMPYKVKEILLFASLYDAFSIEKEGRISDHILGEYYQLNLTTVPRITAVSTKDEAFAQLNQKYFDLIIIMSGLDKKMPIKLSRFINKKFGYIPTYLLVNNNTDISYYQKLKYIDNVFVWNGDSRIFFTMTKLLEDKINVENDTKIGYSRIILLVEDSARYYSRYLPLLYTNVLNQTKRIIDDVSKMDELYKVLRLRARPKVLLASSYEHAIEIFEKYKNNILCLISDVKFPKDGKLTKDAGFQLIKQVRKEIPDLPIVMQSSNIENEKLANEQGLKFIYKNTEALLQEIRNFIEVNLGFGNFIFKDEEGNRYEEAKNLEEFKEKLKVIPEKSINYHAGKNHFSLWLTARGEIQIAKLLAPLQVEDFPSLEHLRTHLINVIEELMHERTKGKTVDFRENSIWDEGTIAILASGALGGKGRGLAFINSLLYSFDLSEFIPKINLRAPRTAIIGIDEFEHFLDRNELSNWVYKVKDYEKIKKRFLDANLSEKLIVKLELLLRQTHKPLAIRSSGLFEDSLMQPFAGIFATYILPNSHENLQIRLHQVCQAIKLVYASVFSKTSRDYINAINYKIEEERMAVIIQEVVGNKYDNVYYPHISGTAQSYNYYPFAHMEPEDGFAVCAIGLGTYVVSGEKAYRFCPKYPTLVNNSPKDQFLNSQVEFYAVNLADKAINLLKGEEAGLVRLDIFDAERHGNLKHTASVYDPENDIISPGLDKAGPRIVNFANILKYNYIPLSETISAVLDIVKEALGSPVEIEFAVDLYKDFDRRATFYLLQIKPLIGNSDDYVIDLDKIDRDSLILYTENGMGNGQIEDITDVIYVDKDRFEKSKTKEIALEIEELNKKMDEENKKYILIGPGRWGTRDPWIGIPVNWTQISNAKIIVETSLENFPLDASAGSHFFHNVTSMNVGYFSIQHHSAKCMINWDILAKQQIINQKTHIKHIRFAKPLIVKMDGKKRISLIQWKKD